MRWGEWVATRDLTWEAAARLIGVANGKVAWRYAHGSIPRPAMMARMWLATSGLVTPNDFYDLPPLSEAPLDYSQQDDAA